MHAWMNQADHYKSGSVRLIPHSFWESYLVQSVHTRRRFLTTNLFSWTIITNKIARKISKIRLRNLQPHWSVYHTNLRLSIATILSVTGDSCVNQKEKKREQSAFHTICRLPWFLTTTLHVFQSRGVISSNTRRDESCYSQHLSLISQKEFTQLPSSFSSFPRTTPIPLCKHEKKNKCICI
jgi:hypothetical protein